MRPRLPQRGTRGRALAGQAVELDRLPHLARRGAVPRQRLRLARGDLRPQPLDRLRRAAVQAAPALAQQRAIGGVLQQGVLEAVAGIGRRRRSGAAARSPRAAPARPPAAPAAGRRRRRQVMREFPPQHRAGQRHLPHRGGAVEPRHQRGLQAAGDREPRQRPLQHPAVRLLAQQRRPPAPPGRPPRRTAARRRSAPGSPPPPPAAATCRGRRGAAARHARRGSAG